MTGTAQKVVHDLHALMGDDATLEPIRDSRNRGPLGRMLRALVDAVTQREPSIGPFEHDPACFYLLILGGEMRPVHARSPVCTYARHYGVTAKRVAFFYVGDGDANDPCDARA